MGRVLLLSGVGNRVVPPLFPLSHPHPRGMGNSMGLLKPAPSMASVDIGSGSPRMGVVPLLGSGHPGSEESLPNPRVRPCPTAPFWGCQPQRGAPLCADEGEGPRPSSCWVLALCDPQLWVCWHSINHPAAALPSRGKCPEGELHGSGWVPAALLAGWHSSGSPARPGGA